MKTGARNGDRPEAGSEPKSARADELMEVLRRADQGDKSCLPALRALLDSGSSRAELIEAYGSPAGWMEGRLIQQSAGKNLAMKEAMTRKLENLRAELSGPSPTPLEKLLVDRAVLCWFVVHTYEARYENASDMTIRQGEYHQRRIDKAHARFLSAVKALAVVRKLALPALQVNLAENQINMVGRQ